MKIKRKFDDTDQSYEKMIYATNNPVLIKKYQQRGEVRFTDGDYKIIKKLNGERTNGYEANKINN